MQSFFGNSAAALQLINRVSAVSRLKEKFARNFNKVFSCGKDVENVG